jgi:hypothetical protein
MVLNIKQELNHEEDCFSMLEANPKIIKRSTQNINDHVKTLLKSN